MQRNCFKLQPNVMHFFVKTESSKFQPEMQVRNIREKLEKATRSRSLWQSGLMRPAGLQVDPRPHVTLTFDLIMTPNYH